MAVRYRVEFTAGAARRFRKLPSEARSRVAARVDAVTEDPRPAGVVAVKHGEGVLRLRVGDYRILSTVSMTTACSSSSFVSVIGVKSMIGDRGSPMVRGIVDHRR